MRIGDSNDLVVIDHFIGLPAGRIRPLDHGIIIICTAGTAKFVYDGQPIELNKDDLFLFMAHSVVEKFESSGDFDCRELWFSRGELWNMNMYIKSSLADILPLKHNPKVALSPTEVALFDVYFQQICQHMRNSSLVLYPEIVRSIVGTFLLETLSVLRRGNSQSQGKTKTNSSGLHGKLFLRVNSEIREAFPDVLHGLLGGMHHVFLVEAVVAQLVQEDFVSWEIMRVAILLAHLVYSKQQRCLAQLVFVQTVLQVAQGRNGEDKLLFGMPVNDF